MDSLEEISKRYIQSKLDEEKQELAENVDNIKKFKELCTKKGLHLAEKNFSYDTTIGVIATYPNLLSY
jgi:SpoVK/Ycf46/Vps4 family AAA+-type ATPase